MQMLKECRERASTAAKSVTNRDIDDSAAEGRAWVGYALAREATPSLA